MKPKLFLFLIIQMFFLSIITSIYSQNTSIQITSKSITEFLVENNKKIDDIQVVILQDINGEISFSTGEALGIKKNNSNEVVIFVLSQTIDPLKLKFSEENDMPFPLPFPGSISILEIKKDNMLHLFYDNIKFSIKF